MEDNKNQDEPPTKKTRISSSSEGKAQPNSNSSPTSAANNRQVDAHVLEFLTRILKSNSSANSKSKNDLTANSKETTVLRKPLKEKRDVGTQTDPVDDEEDDYETDWDDDDDTQSNYGRATPRYSESAMYSNASISNQHSKDSGKVNPQQIQVEFDRWVKDYEKWFKDTFGDVRGLETPGPQQQEDQRQLLQSVRSNNKSEDSVVHHQSVFPQTSEYQSFSNNYEWMNQTVNSATNNTNPQLMGAFSNAPVTSNYNFMPNNHVLQSAEYYTNSIVPPFPPTTISSFSGGFFNPMSTMPFPVSINSSSINSTVALSQQSIVVSASSMPTPVHSLSSNHSPFFIHPQSSLPLSFSMLPPMTSVVPHSNVVNIPNMFTPPPVPMPTIPTPLVFSVPTVIVRPRLMPPPPPPPPPKTPAFPRLAATRTPRSFIGPWGPLIRYGHYGIFNSVEDETPPKNEPPPVSKKLNEDKDSDLLGIKLTDTTLERPLSRSIDVMTDTIRPLNKEFVSMRVHEGNANEEPWSLPPQPPPNIFYPKQSMICTLQMRLRVKARELAIREQDPTLQHTVNYTTALREIVQSGIGLPVLYLYTRIGKLPPKERAFYLGASTLVDGDGVDNDCELPSMDCIEGMPALKRMYVCDLLIGDVLISQSIADWKRRAREAAARQAFAILSQPSFVVGSTRLWCNTQYLVVSVSDSPRRIPVLPPFLSDPTEPLWKKDRYINEASPMENFEIINPKTIEEFWLYMADSNELIAPEQLLAKSADFSQMMVFYEMDILRTGQFSARVYLDSDIGAVAEAPTLLGARKLAAKNLIDKLFQKQPLVSLRPDIKETNEDAFVESLMWGKSELDNAIAIYDLPSHIDIDSHATNRQSSPVKVPSQTVDNPETDPITQQQQEELNEEEERKQLVVRRLQRLVEAYACSAIITPIYMTRAMVPESLWPDVRSEVTTWGLMTQRRPIQNCGVVEEQLIVCKRIPMPRLKKTLLENGVCGVFELKERGDLSEEALNKLDGVLPVVLEVDGDHLNEEENFAVPIDLEIVKKELYQDEDCFITTTELNTRHNPIEILDDLPKPKIPGIDF